MFVYSIPIFAVAVLYAGGMSTLIRCHGVAEVMVPTTVAFEVKIIMQFHVVPPLLDAITRTLLEPAVAA